MNDEYWRSLLSEETLPELERFDDFDNGLVTNEILSLDTMIEDRHAKDTGDNEEDEAESAEIVAPKISDVWTALNTIRTFFSCSTTVEDNIFIEINNLENSVFKKSLCYHKQKK